MTAPLDDRPACRLHRLRPGDLATAAGECGDLFPDSAWRLAAVGRLLDAPGCFALMARAAETAVGLVLARTVADECEILWLVVVPARRRQGIGHRLLRAALRHAAGLGARTAYLEVSEANHAAVALYDSEGFRPCGRRPSYYREGPDGETHDALILKKVLESADGRRPPTSVHGMKKAESRTS